MTAPARTFEARKDTDGEQEPLLIGLAGPPGGGKTVSSLRLATGIKAVRGGDIVLIDTECGRAKKYRHQFDFLRVPFDPPHQSDNFLEAIKQQLPRNPACIIVDSMSDEHEGIGGYLDLRDEMTAKMQGNSWAGTAKPAGLRKKLKTGLLQIKTPLIFTFRAREKTKQDGKKIVNLGWMPVAPLEIVHNLDLTCILPPRADGVPVWTSERLGEDFIIKLPNFLAPFITKGAPLDETTGRALAQWAAGSPTAQAAETSGLDPESPAPSRPPPGVATTKSGAGDLLAQADESHAISIHDDALATAAKQGMDALKAAWATIPSEHHKTLKAALDRRHKVTAAEADERAKEGSKP
jgi:hypothetical protein